MADNNPIHSALLNKAAKNILKPMGLIQKGRSRTWIADQGWWLIVVEFQPSSFSKGSFLNVGCNWLWNVEDWLSFDEGYRVENFQAFKEENEFKLVAEKLAFSAAERVMHYRNLFPSVEKISDYYLKIPPVNSFWPVYNAAIAHALQEEEKRVPHSSLQHSALLIQRLNGKRRVKPMRSCSRQQYWIQVNFAN